MQEHKDTYKILTCYYRPKPGGFCKRLFRAIHGLLDKGYTVHYLSVVPFPINHPNCHFHRFPWPGKKTSGYLFWAFFHFFSPLQILYISIRYKIDRLFAFGHNYSLFMQPVRLIMSIPLTVFLRADTIKNHKLRGRHTLIILLDYFLEGIGIAGTRMYGVSARLTNQVCSRHRLLRPAVHGVLRNDIVIASNYSIREKKLILPLHLACVGVLEPRKNQGFLIDLMKEIPASKAQLYIYGNGPDEAMLKERVKKEGLSSKIHFMGWVPSEEIWNHVDILLMPSLHEGAPNAILEALGNKIIVFASAIPEHSEILPGRYLLSINNVSEWAGRVKQIACFQERNLGNFQDGLEESTKNLVFNWEEEIVRRIV